MNLDFLSRPVDLETAYVLMFGAPVIYGLVMLTLLRIYERRSKREQK